MAKQANNNGANLGFEARLWALADKLRGNMEPSDYKHVVLGLIFLKYISDAFEAKRVELLKDELADAEDPEEYLAGNIFWVPKVARWSHLQASAKQPTIGKVIDDAMLAIEANNASLKGVLLKDYARPALNKIMLGELIDLVSGIGMGSDADRSRGHPWAGLRVLSRRICRSGRQAWRRVLYAPLGCCGFWLRCLNPIRDSVYDPCCGSGGMFVQSEKFVEEHGGRIGDIAIYGQESNYTTWRLAKMNLAVRGIDADIRWNNEGSFHKDELPDLKAQFILANPPFKHFRLGVETACGKMCAGSLVCPRWATQTTHGFSISNQHLAANGKAGVVLANGSMSSGQSGEGDIRRAMVQADVVDCMVALPGQLFYSTQIPACLWFLARDKNPGSGWRDRRGEILFIDARKLGRMVDRTRKEFSEEDIAKIAGAFLAWRGKSDLGAYEDVPGLCKSATLEDIREHNHVLTPGRYVGAVESDADDVVFEERFAELTVALAKQFDEAEELNALIQENLQKVTSNG